ncbi:Glycine--tRNA ligase 1, mitochondrial [Bachmanniomyces sp. S44760]|nr:Glycine--tRNA ligase 1, mitochondrial [Bachmanniomyces sp. S44760]
MDSLTTRDGSPFRRELLESLLKRRFFFTPAFEAYRTFDSCKGATRGLFDYGPPGCALQANVVDLWRKHFVLEEDMLELDCTILTPAEVFKTSGHVDKFADWMCKDSITGEYTRADHLVQNVLEARLKGDKTARGLNTEALVDGEVDGKKAKKQIKSVKAAKLDDALVAVYEDILAKIDNYDGEELSAIITQHDVRNPDNNHLVQPPIPFNLMFQTTIGPSSISPGYLRPETAQGQFLNFNKLLEFNQSKMPFASASIGKAFRNEISPRSGLLRVREFLMAEIEYFVDPENKNHARFEEIRELELQMLDRHTQLAGKTDTQTMTIGKAVEIGMIDNETLGFFLARIHLFLETLGVDQKKLRYRQHMKNEMAHYAADCWDAELYSSYGWIECVGCADRSAFDLKVHSQKTGEQLVVREQRAEPLKIEEWQIDVERRALGLEFRKDAKVVEETIRSLAQPGREAAAGKLNQEGSITLPVPGLGEVVLKPSMLSIVKRTRTESVRQYIPNVIEPSFGIGRIIYCLLEHLYWHRVGDEARGVLSFPPSVAPTKVLIVPLSTHPSFAPHVKQLSQQFRTMRVSHRVDDSSASIGKRYSRNDELGTSFGITVDFDSVKDNTFTLRDRDSTKQVRTNATDIIRAIKNLTDGVEKWTDVFERLPEFNGPNGED